MSVPIDPRPFDTQFEQALHGGAFEPTPGYPDDAQVEPIAFRRLLLGYSSLLPSDAWTFRTPERELAVRAKRREEITALRAVRGEGERR